MGRRFIDYDQLVQDALRGVVRQALRRIEKDGLVGGHHFYISFRSSHPGVEMAGHLREQYPDEMTIVLQHQYWGLEVREDDFEVVLSFGGVDERLAIPFDAVVAFADPSVQFGLQFKGAEAASGAASGAAKGAPEAQPAADRGPRGEADAGADVVTLDSFRGKK